MSEWKAKYLITKVLKGFHSEKSEDSENRIFTVFQENCKTGFCLRVYKYLIIKLLPILAH
jgi:hypothetical protein